MKLQYIAVIFIVIIIPIVIITTTYINSQITTITLQNKYNTKLTDATYDAIKAFRINTVNNRYSSISDSKIRDIEAAVSTFFNTLTSTGDLSKRDIDAYVPALLFTLYDGYYIYSKYDNVVPKENADGDEISNLNMEIITDETELDTGDAYNTDGLKPYVFYSCRYKDRDRDFVVNYTLDNAITIYGTLRNWEWDGNTCNLTTGYSYQTLSGYLINPNYVEIIDNGANPINWKLKYKYTESGSGGSLIESEILTEHLLFTTTSTDASGTQIYDNGDYEYIVYNGQKIYYDKNETTKSTPYFYYNNYGKSFISNAEYNKDVLSYLNARLSTEADGSHHLYSTNAFEYYRDAKKFSEIISKLTDGISQEDAVDLQGNNIEFDVATGDRDIFVTNDSRNPNDPLLSKSIFDENRMQVIRNSIKTNLAVAIGNYNRYSTNSYQYSFPELDEVDWGKITNEVSVISFLQGIPIGYKFYNNYCVITNNDNEEVVKKDNIYIITKDNTGNNREYHLPGCTYLMNCDFDDIEIERGYSNIDFLRQTVRISEDNNIYFYPQTRVNMIGGRPSKDTKNITACYYCMVNATNVHSADDIIKGEIVELNEQEQEEAIISVLDSRIGTDTQRKALQKIREYYLTALGRERFNLYQANMSGFNT